MNSRVVSGGASAAVRALRPRQWVKNLLVVAVPAAAGRLFEIDVLVASLVAVVAFCLASSAVYLVNDINDREVDRLHPVKSLRPIASGELSVRVAVAMAVPLTVSSVVIAALVDVHLALVLGGYLVMQFLYSLWLKHEPVLDLAIVATGFLLRTVAGGVATDIEASNWFLVVAGFGSLFVVAAKRHSEIATLGVASGTRRALLRYTEPYLRFVWTMAATATVLGYSLWAFETDTPGALPWHAVSVVPFVLGVLRYALVVDLGRAGEPEEVIYSDRRLQIVGLVWLGVLAVGAVRG